MLPFSFILATRDFVVMDSAGSDQLRALMQLSNLVLKDDFPSPSQLPLDRLNIQTISPTTGRLA
jgi:hypothetical protein